MEVGGTSRQRHCGCVLDSSPPCPESQLVSASCLVVCSWEMDVAFPLMPAFLFSALTVPCNFCVGGVIQGHVDLVVEGPSMAAIPTTVPELKAALVSRRPIQPCPFTPVSLLCVGEEAGTAAVSGAGRTRAVLSFLNGTYQARFSCALPFGDGGLNCGGYLRTVICPGGLFGNCPPFFALPVVALA